MQKAVTTYFLEMSDPAQLRPPRRPADDLTIVHAAQPTPEFSRFFYTAVGGTWYWTKRLPWTYTEWLAHLGRAGYELWYGTHAGAPVGYFELVRGAADAVDILCFGLLPRYIGRGFGGSLLTAAVTRAWALGPPRVTVDTCTLDGPHALGNYQARGFQIMRQVTTLRDLPELPPGPWPGAGL